MLTINLAVNGNVVCNHSFDSCCVACRINASKLLTNQVIVGDNIGSIFKGVVKQIDSNGRTRGVGIVAHRGTLRLNLHLVVASNIFLQGALLLAILVHVSHVNVIHLATALATRCVKVRRPECVSDSILVIVDSLHLHRADLIEVQASCTQNLGIDHLPAIKDTFSRCRTRGGFRGCRTRSRAGRGAGSRTGSGSFTWRSTWGCTGRGTR